MNVIYVVITVILGLVVLAGILLNIGILQAIGYAGLLLVLLSLGYVRK